MGVHRKSSTAAVKGELGSFPVLMYGLCSSVKYLANLHKRSPDSVIANCLKENYALLESNDPCWLQHLKRIFETFEMHSYWNNMGGNNIESCIQILLEKLHCNYEFSWLKYIQGENRVNNKLRTYCTIKTSFCREEYLNMNLRLDKRKNLTKLRISAHDLKIETGRYTKTDIQNRICLNCNNHQIEDETHFLLNCSLYHHIRNDLTVKLQNYNYTNLSEDEKLKFLLTGSQGDHYVIRQTLSYINAAFDVRKTA